MPGYALARGRVPRPIALARVVLHNMIYQRSEFIQNIIGTLNQSRSLPNQLMATASEWVVN